MMNLAADFNAGVARWRNVAARETVMNTSRSSADGPVWPVADDN
ncbi:hypothetical protein [Pantoea stewartii]